MKEPRSMAICLERVEATSPHEQYLQCVALPGNRPGLVLDASGVARWCEDVAAACELWISADEALIVLRPAGAPTVRLERAGRGLELPEGKPVELIDEDELIVGGVRHCVHVHGFTVADSAPTWLTPAPQLAGSRGRVGATAAALAFGAAVTLGGMSADAGKSKPKPPVLVRPMPPAPPPPPPPPKKKPPTKKKPAKKKPSDKK